MPSSTIISTFSPPYIITAVQAQQKNPARCSVFINGEFAFGCSLDLVLRFGFAKGKELSEADITRALEQEDMMRLKQVALRYATYKSRTAFEVRQKMLEKEYSPEEADYAVRFLEEFGYVDDAVYSRTFIKDFLQRTPSGMSRIRQELLRRGIPVFVVEDALAEAFPKESVHETLLENARKAAHKKRRSLVGKDPRKQEQALIGYLQRRGFSWDVIRRVLQEAHDEISSDIVSSEEDADGIEE